MNGRRKHLPDGVVVAVAGDDATEFLQGQFTNDVEAATPERAVFGAFCNPKGRVQALATALRRSDGYWLVTEASVADDLIAALRRYVLRADVRFATVTDCGVALTDGRGGDQPWSLRGDGGAKVWQLPGGLAMAAGPHDQLGDERDAEALDQALVGTGVPTVVDATRERFTPQMLNLDLLGGISFDKGCYTGQEIVARTQHLGSIKRRMLRFACAAAQPAIPGSDVLGSDGKRVGTVVRAAPAVDGQTLLAVVRVTAVEGAVLPTGEPLTRLDLPYSV